MGTVLKGATLIELEPSTVEVADLRIEEGRIAARGELNPQEGDEVVDLSGKVLIPGLVSGHHRLVESLWRAAVPSDPEAGYVERLEQGRWRLDRHLDGDLIETAATVGALEALRCGTTTLFDLHASPGTIEGSLLRVARGVNDVGLRGVLSYEVSDRHGALGREEGLEENARFIARAQGRFRAMVGAHASYTLSPDALEGLSGLVTRTGAGLHLQLADDVVDERLSFERFGEVPVARLQSAGLLSQRSTIASVVHLSWPELSQVIATGAWVAHTPRTNMEDQVGYAPALKFGARATLGTVSGTPDLFAEARVARLRSLEAGQPIDALRYLANGHRMAADAFGVPMGPLREGAVADLVVLGYQPPSDLTAENLAGHILSGMGSRHVESVMVDGVWRLWARQPLTVDGAALTERSREGLRALLSRCDES